MAAVVSSGCEVGSYWCCWCHWCRFPDTPGGKGSASDPGVGSASCCKRAESTQLCWPPRQVWGSCPHGSWWGLTKWVKGGLCFSLHFVLPVNLFVALLQNTFSNAVVLQQFFFFFLFVCFIQEKKMEKKNAWRKRGLRLKLYTSYK